MATDSKRLPPATGAPKSVSPADREFFNQNPSPLATHEGTGLFDDLDPDGPVGLFDDLDPDTPAEAPKRVYQAWEVMPEMMDHAAPSLAGLAKSAWDTISNPVEAARGVDNIVTGLGMHLLTPDVREMVAKNYPHGQDALGAVNALGKHFSDRMGSPEAFTRTAVEDPFGLGADLASVLPFPGAQNLNALRLANPIGTGVGHVGRGVVNRLHPQESLVLDMVEGRGQRVLDAERANAEARRVSPAGPIDPDTPGVAPEVIEASRTTIPGNVPTAAQAAAGMRKPDGTPDIPTGLAGAERGARDRAGTMYSEINDAQNKARLDLLDTVVPDDLDRLVRDRNDRSSRDYAAAGVVRDPNNPPPIPVARVMVRTDPDFVDLTSNPHMQKALIVGRELTEGQDLEFEIGSTTPGGPTPTSVLGHDGRPVTVNSSPTFSEMPAQSLHNIKLAFDDMIKNPQDHGLKRANVDAVRAIRNRYITWMERANPAYRTARQNYAADSRVVDQATMQQFLRQNMVNPTLGDDTVNLKGDWYSRAIDDYITKNPNVRKGTGETRYRNLDEIYTPEQMEILNRIRDDLARAKLATEKGKSGKRMAREIEATPTAPNIPNLLDRVVASVNIASKLLTGHVSDRIANRTTNALASPESFIPMLEQALQHDARINNLSNNLKGTGTYIGTGNPLDIGLGLGTILAGQYGRIVGGLNERPIVYNALEAERENRKQE